MVVAGDEGELSPLQERARAKARKATRLASLPPAEREIEFAMLSPQDRGEVLNLMPRRERNALMGIDVEKVREEAAAQEREAHAKEIRLEAKIRSRGAIETKRLSDGEKATQSRAKYAFVCKEQRMVEAREERAHRDQREVETRVELKVNPTLFWERQVGHQEANAMLKVASREPDPNPNTHTHTPLDALSSANLATVGGSSCVSLANARCARTTAAVCQARLRRESLERDMLGFRDSPRMNRISKQLTEELVPIQDRYEEVRLVHQEGILVLRERVQVSCSALGLLLLCLTRIPFV